MVKKLFFVMVLLLLAIAPVIAQDETLTVLCTRQKSGALR